VEVSATLSAFLKYGELLSEAHRIIINVDRKTNHHRFLSNKPRNNHTPWGLESLEADASDFKLGDGTVCHKPKTMVDAWLDIKLPVFSESELRASPIIGLLRLQGPLKCMMQISDLRDLLRVMMLDRCLKYR
jgi:hypothetical protein